MDSRAYSKNNMLGFLPLIPLLAMTPELLTFLGVSVAIPIATKFAKPLYSATIKYSPMIWNKTKSLWMAMPISAQIGSVAASSAATWAAINWAAKDDDYDQSGKALAKVLKKYQTGDNLIKYLAMSAPFTRAWMINAAQNGVPENPTSDRAFVNKIAADSGLSFNDAAVLTFAMTEAQQSGTIPNAVWNGTSKTAQADLELIKEKNEAMQPKKDWQDTALVIGAMVAGAIFLSKKND